jgi:hypothetical protein
MSSNRPNATSIHGSHSSSLWLMLPPHGIGQACMDWLPEAQGALAWSLTSHSTRAKRCYFAWLQKDEKRPERFNRPRLIIYGCRYTRYHPIKQRQKALRQALLFPAEKEHSTRRSCQTGGAVRTKAETPKASMSAPHRGLGLQPETQGKEYALAGREHIKRDDQAAPCLAAVGRDSLTDADYGTQVREQHQ